MCENRTISNKLMCSCGSYNVESLTPYDQRVKLYCIDCGSYHFLTAQQYNDFCNNYNEWIILKIQFRKSLTRLRCLN